MDSLPVVFVLWGPHDGAPPPVHDSVLAVEAGTLCRSCSKGDQIMNSSIDLWPGNSGGHGQWHFTASGMACRESVCWLWPGPGMTESDQPGLSSEQCRAFSRDQRHSASDWGWSCTPTSTWHIDPSPGFITSEVQCWSLSIMKINAICV